MTAVLNLLNLLLPTVSNVVLLLEHQDGTTTAIVASAQAATAQDEAQIAAWIKGHGGTPSTPTT